MLLLSSLSSLGHVEIEDHGQALMARGRYFIRVKLFCAQKQKEKIQFNLIATRVRSDMKNYSLVVCDPFLSFVIFNSSVAHFIPETVWYAF